MVHLKEVEIEKNDYWLHFSCAYSRSIYDVHIEVYTNKKDTDIEAKVEEILDKHKIFYNKSEVWIPTEKLYETIYSFESEVD